MTLAAISELTPLWVIIGYLGLLIGLGVVSGRLFRGTSSDYFVATRSIGPFLLLMSVFGTTMTAFALVGSTGKAFDRGVGVYGLMASSSGIVHSLIFFLIGMKLWAIGKRYGYVTQIQYFRDRFDSNGLGYLLFPILVALVIPYLLIGVIGAGTVLEGVTQGMFPDVFEGRMNPAGKMIMVGAVPRWLSGLVICAVVLFYISGGGLRGAAWANAFQTIVFMTMGVVAFWLISNRLGGLEAASRAVQENARDHLGRDGMITKPQFLSYMLVPFSVGMFPHLFQHWLTARSAKTFRLSIVAHPIFIMIVWVPCILIGIWAAGQGITPPGGNSNAVLALMVNKLIHNDIFTGLLTAGILAAIMSSLDSQFVCLGTMFTHDIVLHSAGEDRFTDRQKVLIGRGFIVAIVAITYGLSLLDPPNIFDLAVWCFSGFASLFPLVFCAVYWRRTTKVGAFSSILVMVGVWLYFFLDWLEQSSAGHDPEEYLVGGVMPVVFIFAASAVTLFVVSLVTKAPRQQVVDRFFAVHEAASLQEESR
ncbi:MAG: sodium:solute symporter family protein [Planctomycetota bacterium]